MLTVPFLLISLLALGAVSAAAAAASAACKEVHVTKGCENTDMDVIVGTYEPLENAATLCSETDRSIDTSRMVYIQTSSSASGMYGNVYLLYSGSSWKFVWSTRRNASCERYEFNNFEATFSDNGASTEPFEEPVDDTISCYDGFIPPVQNGESRYTTTDFALRCVDTANDGGSGEDEEDNGPAGSNDKIDGDPSSASPGNGKTRNGLWFQLGLTALMVWCFADAVAL